MIFILFFIFCAFLLLAIEKLQNPVQFWILKFRQ
jgi:hypothetical protein